MSIKEFYFVMTTLWNQLAFTEPPKLSVFALYITHRESQRLV